MIEGDDTGKSNLQELFHNGPSQNFRRAALGVVIQCFQQITGKSCFEHKLHLTHCLSGKAST